MFFCGKLRLFIPSCETAQEDEFTSLITPSFEIISIMMFTGTVGHFQCKNLFGTMTTTLFATQITFGPSDSDDTKLQYVQLLITATEK